MAAVTQGGRARYVMGIAEVIIGARSRDPGA
jgi:hypothetical protein